MAMIRMRDVVKEYPGRGRGAEPIRAVDGVSLDIEAGSIYGVIGYSGAGKSTLVRLINALEPTTSGSIEIDGDEIVGLPESKLREVRTELGMTIVVITHEMEVIKRIATHVAVMERGRVVEHGSVYDVFSDPQHAATRRFVSTVIPAVPEGRELEALRERHTGALITVTVTDEGRAQHEVLGRLVRAGVDAQLVHGGMHELTGRAFGHLTFALHGEPDAERAAIESVREIAEVVELPATVGAATAAPIADAEGGAA